MTVGLLHISETLQQVSSALVSESVYLSVFVYTESCRRLYPVCGRGEKQQFGHKVPAGPPELPQWGSVDGRMESPARLPAVPQLPELVQGAAAQSG